MITIARYGSDRKAEWDGFVRNSKNGTFLFLRDYMDYQADRFRDHSLLFYYDEKLIALLPANSREGESEGSFSLVSHGGLTYGGLVMSPDTTAHKVCEIFQALLAYLKERGCTELIYKAVPHIYHRMAAE